LLGLKENVIIGRLIPARLEFPGMDKLLEPEPAPEIAIASGGWLGLPGAPEGEAFAFGGPMPPSGDQALLGDNAAEDFDLSDQEDGASAEESDGDGAPSVEASIETAATQGGQSEASTNGLEHGHENGDGILVAEASEAEDDTPVAEASEAEDDTPVAEASEAEDDTPVAEASDGLNQDSGEEDGEPGEGIDGGAELGGETADHEPEE
jgi:hypothetical protein